MKKIVKIAYTALLASAPFLMDWGLGPYMIVSGLILMTPELHKNKQYNIIAVNIISIIGWLFTILN